MAADAINIYKISLTKNEGETLLTISIGYRCNQDLRFII